jgi:hypothetical protein
LGDAERVRRWVESTPTTKSISVPLASVAVGEIFATAR